MNYESSIEVKSLKKKMGNFCLDNIDFSLNKGYILGFMGRNGAGKTTTIKTLLNLYVRDSGVVNVFGLDSFKGEKTIKDRVGYVSDEKMYMDDLTIEQIRNLVAPFYSKWNNSMFYEYIDRFELPRYKKIKKLSKGSYKKFSIAMALSHEPELLILDEPTSDLDPIFRNEFLDILRDFVSNDINSIFFSSHITTDLDKIADYIVLIDNGQIKINMSKEELLDSHRIVRARTGMIDTLNISDFRGIKKTDFGVEGLCSNLSHVKELQEKDCIIEVPTLEDIMFYTVKGVGLSG